MPPPPFAISETSLQRHEESSAIWTNFLLLLETIVYCTAVAIAEHFATFVSFRWHQPNLPPTQNDRSAPSSRVLAGRFSGNYANNAKFATTTAIFLTFSTLKITL